MQYTAPSFENISELVCAANYAMLYCTWATGGHATALEFLPCRTGPGLESASFDQLKPCLRLPILKTSLSLQLATTMTSRLSRAIWPLLQRSRAAASPAAFSTRLYASEAASAAPAFGSASTSSSAQSSSSTKQPTRIPRNLLQPGAKVSKRPHRERPPNPGLGARVPRAPVPDVSQPVYLPNFKIVLCRNGPAHADDPYTATFRVPMSLTKPDIVSFLTQAYGLSITGIRTLIYRGEVVKMFHPGLSRRKGPGRKPGYKKAIIQMTQPFWYPERPSEDWLEQKFAL